MSAEFRQCSYDFSATAALKLEHASESPSRLIKTQIVGLHPQSFRLGRSRVGPEGLHL